jgi:hypothetical protein
MSLSGYRTAISIQSIDGRYRGSDTWANHNRSVFEIPEQNVRREEDGCQEKNAGAELTELVRRLGPEPRICKFEDVM